jgi:hypothetical protein
VIGLTSDCREANRENTSTTQHIVTPVTSSLTIGPDKERKQWLLGKRLSGSTWAPPIRSWL